MDVILQPRKLYFADAELDAIVKNICASKRRIAEHGNITQFPSDPETKHNIVKTRVQWHVNFKSQQLRGWNVRSLRNFN